MRKSLFSLCCFVMAIAILAFYLIAAFLPIDEILLIYIALGLNLISPIILLIGLGASNLPKKEEK